MPASSEWYQQALTPPEVIEANLRIGLIPSQDHAQAWIELKDPRTSIVIAQWSCPHVSIRDVRDLVATAADRLVAFLDDEVDPF